MALSEMKVFSKEAIKASNVKMALHCMGFFTDEQKEEVKLKKTNEHEIIMAIVDMWDDLPMEQRVKLSYFNMVHDGNLNKEGEFGFQITEKGQSIVHEETPKKTNNGSKMKKTEYVKVPLEDAINHHGVGNSGIFIKQSDGSYYRLTLINELLAFNHGLYIKEEREQAIEEMVYNYVEGSEYLNHETDISEFTLGKSSYGSKEEEIGFKREFIEMCCEVADKHRFGKNK